MNDETHGWANRKVKQDSARQKRAEPEKTESYR